MDVDDEVSPTKTKTIRPNRGNTCGNSNGHTNNNNGPVERSFYIFSFNITQLSPILKFFILVGGLILFMCLQGYYQELVIYGWFNRKLSMFSTFLQFLVCSIFAQVQRNMSNSSSSSVTSTTAQSTQAADHPAPQYASSATSVHNSLSDKFSFLSHFAIHMGTASPKVSLGYYTLITILRTISQALSNLSMTQINYPAKVLFKSANPVITMIIGVLWFHKSYPIRDYFVVVLFVIGLYVFITGDNDDDNDPTEVPSATILGLFYVSISMFTGASVPMIQEHCMTKYHASVDDLLYSSFLGGTLLSLLITLFNGELYYGIQFLWTSSSLYTTFIFIAFCTFGFFGANFSIGITSQYGALVNGICNTFRKAVTIGLSFVLFPERNHLTLSKIYGLIIFFSGLLIRIVFKQHQERMHHLHHTSDDSSQQGVGVREIGVELEKDDDLRSLLDDSDEEKGLDDEDVVGNDQDRLVSTN